MVDSRSPRERPARREREAVDATKDRAPITARSLALDILEAVSDSDAYANLLLPQRLRVSGLDDRDAGLATELTYGTLRKQGLYDVIIAIAAGRPIEAIDGTTRNILRLGVHQLCAMRVPAHAAVSATVDLVRKQSARGFVNGVLRTISRTDPEEWVERAVATATSGEERLAIEHSHPLWVVRTFRQVLTAEDREAELEALLAADNVAPAVSLTALPGLATVAELDARPGSVSPVGAVLPGGDPAGLPAVRAGRARVQDQGSALAALALSRARPIVAGERWLDLCAGPGGKAALLAAEAAIGGARLVANELVPQRAGLVRQAVKVFERGEHPVEVVQGDGTTMGDREPEAFDRILLDAPCTGLGALRRRPEARWRKQPSDIAGLGELQTRLLDAAIAALRPGGVLAYITCSPHAGETKAIVAQALRRHPGLRALDTQSVVRSIAVEPLDLAPGMHVQLWPHRHGTDAMFIQLLTKE